MTHPNSIDIWDKIVSSGIVSKKRLEVLSIIRENGAMTGGQASIIYRKQKGYVGTSESIRNRITELLKQGALTDLGDIRCPVTGNMSRQVVYSNQMPTPYSVEKRGLFILRDPRAGVYLLFKSERQAEDYKIKHGFLGEIHKLKDMRKFEE